MKLFLNEDCMDVMKRYPDNYFDLAIVDPPYFSGPEQRKFYGNKISPIGVNRLYGKTPEWKIPNRDYFDELFRVSKNQIIWGVNYFNYSFGSGRIVWDKVNGQYKTTKPDTDNLQKLLKDCMTKLGYWQDDAQVASEIVEKFWADTVGIYIKIEELP
ncbi:RusA family crossover junction endodeoxyribonuclease [Streptococcus mitis]|uniref:RusA family crossover junction endodeoxyribonuclease n=1 Tax=Streptococcus mitis TaxID=28037 RepID=UPI001F15A452|nr:RusA family crossover junction endodeoxyribonuclease [Streptococcus mitis]